MKRVFYLITIGMLAMTGITSCKTVQKIESKPVDVAVKEVQQWTPVGLKSIADNLLNGEWIFIDAMREAIVGEETPHIIFDTVTHRIYGSNGCNNFNGTLLVEHECGMRFIDCISTLKACSPDVTDTNIMQALGNTRYYNVVEQTNDKITMTLLDENGNAVATLAKQMRLLLGGLWEVIEVDGKHIHLDEKPSMVIDIESRKLTGNSGCNLINGTIDYGASSHNNIIAFTDVVTTRRMCAPDVMSVESSILDALNRVDAFRFIDESHVALYSSTSTHIQLILKRK